MRTPCRYHHFIVLWVCLCEYVQLAQPIPFSPGNIFILPGKKVHTHTHTNTARQTGNQPFLSIGEKEPEKLTDSTTIATTSNQKS